MSGIALDREGILALVPHQGAMCLWDEVVSWDGDRIMSRSATAGVVTTAPARWP